MTVHTNTAARLPKRTSSLTGLIKHIWKRHLRACLCFAHAFTCQRDLPDLSIVHLFRGIFSTPKQQLGVWQCAQSTCLCHPICSSGTFCISYPIEWTGISPLVLDICCHLSECSWFCGMGQIISHAFGTRVSCNTRHGSIGSHLWTLKIHSIVKYSRLDLEDVYSDIGGTKNCGTFLNIVKKSFIIWYTLLLLLLICMCLIWIWIW